MFMVLSVLRYVNFKLEIVSIAMELVVKVVSILQDFQEKKATVEQCPLLKKVGNGLTPLPAAQAQLPHFNVEHLRKRMSDGNVYHCAGTLDWFNAMDTATPGVCVDEARLMSRVRQSLMRHQPRSLDSK